MDAKPKGFIHWDKRAGHEVIVIGRAAIPIVLAEWAWGLSMGVTFILALVGWSTGDESLPVPFYWVGGLSLSAAILLIVGVLIALAVEVIIDVNRKENI